MKLTDFDPEESFKILYKSINVEYNRTEIKDLLYKTKYKWTVEQRNNFIIDLKKYLKSTIYFYMSFENDVDLFLSDFGLEIVESNLIDYNLGELK